MDWLKELISFDSPLKLGDWKWTKNGRTSYSHGEFWKGEEILKAYSPSCSSTYVIWLSCIWSQFEPATQKSRECEKLAGGADWFGGSK